MEIQDAALSHSSSDLKCAAVEVYMGIRKKKHYKYFCFYVGAEQEKNIQLGFGHAKPNASLEYRLMG